MDGKKLLANKEEHVNLAILIIGRTGSGKSSLANCIKGDEAEPFTVNDRGAMSSTTTNLQERVVDTRGRRVRVRICFKS
jgi:predicted GTPase